MGNSCAPFFFQDEFLIDLSLLFSHAPLFPRSAPLLFLAELRFHSFKCSFIQSRFSLMTIMIDMTHLFRGFMNNAFLMDP